MFNFAKEAELYNKLKMIWGKKCPIFYEGNGDILFPGADYLEFLGWYANESDEACLFPVELLDAVIDFIYKILLDKTSKDIEFYSNYGFTGSPFIFKKKVVQESLKTNKNLFKQLRTLDIENKLIGNLKIDLQRKDGKRYTILKIYRNQFDYLEELENGNNFFPGCKRINITGYFNNECLGYGIGVGEKFDEAIELAFNGLNQYRLLSENN